DPPDTVVYAPPPRPEARAPARATPSDEAEAEGGTGAAIAVGAGLVIVIALAVVVLVGAGAAMWWFASRPGDAPPAVEVPPAGDATGPPVETPPPATSEAAAPISVRVTGEPAQWIKVWSGDAPAAESRGDLDGQVVPGNYTLTIKIVGRPAVKADIEVGDDGLALECASDARQNVNCQGGKRSLTLKP
ncbi:MAG: hypothetical protein FJ090_11290, partial [Deltaproteobacteria bacterium]|nr:hypothetical protein [Deltaproteobacteria bacterium]